jgi:hypothetical protein
MGMMKRSKMETHSAPSLTTHCDTAIAPPRSFRPQANCRGVGGRVRRMHTLLLRMVRCSRDNNAAANDNRCTKHRSFFAAT